MSFTIQEVSKPTDLTIGNNKVQTQMSARERAIQTLIEGEKQPSNTLTAPKTSAEAIAAALAPRQEPVSAPEGHVTVNEGLNSSEVPVSPSSPAVSETTPTKPSE